VPDIHKFMKDYRLDCEAALDRLESGTSFSSLASPLLQCLLTLLVCLLVAGVPDNPDSAIDPKVVAETVQFFITAMDSLKLNMSAIDQVGVDVVRLS